MAARKNERYSIDKRADDRGSPQHLGRAFERNAGKIEYVTLLRGVERKGGILLREQYRGTFV